MSAEPPAPPLAPGLPIPEDVPRVYTNFVLLQPGAMDVTLVMGHQVASAAPSWSVEATMSWEEAKLLIKLLDGAITAHEQAFGAVRDISKAAEELLAKTAGSQPKEDS